MQWFKGVFRKLTFNWTLGIFLIILFGSIRFFLVLQANKSGNYQYTSLVFIAMGLLPFILLTKAGRKQVGMIWPKSGAYLLIGFILGGIFALMVYILGQSLYGDGIQNWYVYIKSSMIPNSGHFGISKTHLFWISAVISMAFSPIGEELLYRGLIHNSFESEYGKFNATWIDASAFSLVHLAHFGIVYTDQKWHFLLWPSLIWMALMFLASLLFSFFRNISGSIYAAVFTHAGFNFVMVYTIFYMLQW